jgi:hypothetical protein
VVVPLTVLPPPLAKGIVTVRGIQVGRCGADARPWAL